MKAAQSVARLVVRCALPPQVRLPAALVLGRVFSLPLEALSLLLCFPLAAQVTSMHRCVCPANKYHARPLELRKIQKYGNTTVLTDQPPEDGLAKAQTANS